MLRLTAMLHAQDARIVTEPKLPPACVTLDALLTASDVAKESETSATDTERVQRALDQCHSGYAVILRAAAGKDAFLTGPLQLREAVTLVVDRGTTLFASRNPSLYEESPGSCGVVNQASTGCKPLIAAQHGNHAGVMGLGTIDGQGGATILPLGRHVSWWDLAEQARSGGRQQVPRLIVTAYANDFTLYGIRLKNSPNFHVVFNHGDGLTVWGVTIDTPRRGARNTDGIDPGQGSKNITITHSFIRTGDDNVAIKGGPGEATNITISHNHFYWGHGMSIGSETDGGVSRIRVVDLSLDGPDNGLRIKSNGSRGGLVDDVVYDDVCIRDSPNPLVLDTAYTAAGTPRGDSPPTFRNIVFRNVRIAGGGKLTFQGYDATHRVAATLDNVLQTGGAPTGSVLRYADLQFGPGPMNLTIAPQPHSTISGKISNGSPQPCAAKFVDFPVH